MFNLLLCGIVGTLLVWVTVLDLRAGEIRLRSRAAGRPPQFVRRAEYPLLFVALLVMRGFGALLVLLLITGWFMSLIQWSI